MAEDWTAIAAEVGEAIKSVASTDDGFPATIRRQTSSGDPWNPSVTYGYTTVRVIEENRRVRNIDGSYVAQSQRTLTLAATGFVPQKGDEVATGITESEAGDDSEWRVITAVRTLAPAGTAVLYELDVTS